MDLVCYGAPTEHHFFKQAPWGSSQGSGLTVVSRIKLLSPHFPPRDRSLKERRPEGGGD